jgi:hypothetical protein
MEIRCPRCGFINPGNQPVCINCELELQQNVNMNFGQRPPSAKGYGMPPGPQTRFGPSSQHYPPNQTPYPGDQNPFYRDFSGQPKNAPRKGSSSPIENIGGLFSSMLDAHHGDSDSIADGAKIPPRSYPALKLYLSIVRILSWIFAVAAVIGGLVSGIKLMDWNFFYGVLAFLGGLIAGLLIFVASSAGIDLFRLLINIEDNTRRSANINAD